MLIFAFNGVAESQSATMLLQLKKEDSHIRVTQDEETWIGMCFYPKNMSFESPLLAHPHGNNNNV